MVIASAGIRYSANPAARSPDSGQRRNEYAITPNSSNGMPKPSIGCQGKAWPSDVAAPKPAASTSSSTPSHSRIRGFE